MKREKIANLISIVLGPHVWLPVLFLLVILRSGLPIKQFWILFPPLLLLQVILPLVYLSFAKKLGLATAWDLPKRKERYLFLLINFIAVSISLFLIYKFGNPLLFKLNILLFFLSLLLSVITFYWKISLHTSLNTFGSILVNFLFDFKLPVLYLTIPLVFWARLVLKRHTVGQLIVGIILSAAITVLGLAVFF